MKEHLGYTPADWLRLAIAALAVVPFIGVRFWGVAAGSCVLGRSYDWRGDRRGGVLSLVGSRGTGDRHAAGGCPRDPGSNRDRAPFEAILAFRQQVELAAASMTGANRLLLGLGWPLIMFVAYLASHRRGKPQSEIKLDERQSLQLAFLLLASCYALVIVAKHSISLFDAAVLLLIYAAYVYVAWVTGGEVEEELEHGVGVRTKKLPQVQRRTIMGLFLAIGAFVLYFGAQPFLDAIISLARHAGVSEFALIQWLVPFISEFPESLTAYIWAAMVVGAGMGLSNLISSKLNQWTLLIATIPAAYSLGAGRAAALPLTARSHEEIFLTAAQSLFGGSLLLDRKFTMKRAAALLILFLVQFAFTSQWIRIAVGGMYLVLAIVVTIWQWPRIELVTDLSRILKMRNQ